MDAAIRIGLSVMTALLVSAAPRWLAAGVTAALFVAGWTAFDELWARLQRDAGGA